MGTGSSANDACVYVYVAGSYDGGTTWPDTVTGADAAITFNGPTQLRLLGIVNAASGTITGIVYVGEPWSVAAAFGGNMPPNWSVQVRNYTGVALDASAGGTIGYVGLTYTNT